ncbi:MAG: cache domain-containing protein [Sneathiella sp.]|nr:cache domain-containing protein [Sneathiella sp.]
MFRSISLGLALCVMLFSGLANAEDKKAVVTEMMSKVVAHFEAKGAEQAYKDFAVKDSDFYKGEYYVAAFDIDTGNTEFHAANAKLIGKNLTKLKDTDGVVFVAEMLKVARDKGEGWVSYKWPHPVTKKITQKHSMVHAVGNLALMIGYYE